MKKLFTLCASALLAFTLSAQSEHAEGSIYLGTGDATQLLNLFQGVGMTGTIGYAVQDDWVVQGTVTNDNAGNNTFNMEVRYYTNGFGFGVILNDATETNGDRDMHLAVGKYLTVGSISDRLFCYPNITIDSDQNMSSGIQFGFRF
tara:strand:- start:743 stop:1180 length:438 start_codon:yes stop_codon:yes gene_type:complete